MPKNKVSDPITDQETARPQSPDRQQVLDRLWEIANLSPDMTRGSITGQVKAISMIIAMENFIPDRRAVSAQKKSAPTPAEASPNPSQSTFANRVSSSAAPTQPPSGPLFNSVPDLGVDFPIKNPFVHPR